MRTRWKRAASIVLALLTCLVCMPLPARAGVSPETIAARQRFFGKGNVNARSGQVRKDRVILSWFSVSSYAAAFNGHVVLLDAWIARGSHSGYVPTTTDELIALDPEFIFVGHGDFDHAADVGTIASGSGATIVGSPEHCDWARGDSGDDTIPCVEAAPAAAPPGLRKELRLIPGVGISAVTHLHSSIESYENDRTPCPPIWNPQDTLQNPPTPGDIQRFVESAGSTRGANILYQFRVGDLALTWHDTVGKIEEDAPQAVDAIKSLPDTDIHSGAVLAFGQVTNCMRSLGQYMRALEPKLYTPNHHDNFVAIAGDNAEDLEQAVRDEIERLPAELRPDLLYTYDPDAYIRPDLFTWNPKDPRWD